MWTALGLQWRWVAKKVLMTVIPFLLVIKWQKEKIKCNKKHFIFWFKSNFFFIQSKMPSHSNKPTASFANQYVIGQSEGPRLACGCSQTRVIAILFTLQPSRWAVRRLHIPHSCCRLTTSRPQARSWPSESPLHDEPLNYESSRGTPGLSLHWHSQDPQCRDPQTDRAEKSSVQIISLP